MGLEVKGGAVNAKELDGFIAGLANEFGPRNSLAPVRKALRDTLTPLVDEVKAATPVRTGALRGSTKLAISTGKSRSEYVAEATVGWRFPRGKGGTPRVPQGRSIEFGNVRGQQGRKVILGVFDANTNRMNQQLSRNLAQAFVAAVRKYARQRGRGTLKVR